MFSRTAHLRASFKGKVKRILRKQPIMRLCTKKNPMNSHRQKRSSHLLYHLTYVIRFQCTSCNRANGLYVEETRPHIGIFLVVMAGKIRIYGKSMSGLRPTGFYFSNVLIRPFCLCAIQVRQFESNLLKHVIAWTFPSNLNSQSDA